jgi:hypothetical protein
MRDRLDAPSAAFREPGIHAVKIGCENGGFITACARAYLYDCGTVVQRIMWNEGGLDTLLQLRDRALEPRLFGARFGGHLRVINGNELVHVRELVFVFVEKAGHFNDRGQMAVLSSQRGHPLGVLYCAGIGELPLDLAGAVKGVGEAIPETQVSGVAGAASRDLVAYF